MISKLRGEEWKPLTFKGSKSLRNKYALSSRGRAASFKEDIYRDGKILRGSMTSGYRTINLHIDGQSTTLYFHREIAKLFLKKSSSKEKFVIHLNYDKADNNFKNLQWASQKKVIEHQQNSPDKLAYKEVQRSRTTGMKLNATQVKAIKKVLENPRRRLTHKQLANKYDVSEMTIYRIKSGENWEQVTI